MNVILLGLAERRGQHPILSSLIEKGCIHAD
jgi:hypothetical protein